MSVLDLDERTISDALETMRADNLGRIRTYADGRITYDLGAREVYSYGRHFPLAHACATHVYVHMSMVYTQCSEVEHHA